MIYATNPRRRRHAIGLSEDRPAARIARIV